jgi:hypothetical protein
MIITTIQLTGDVKGYLDIKDGKAVPVIYSSSDIRDLSSKKGNTSRNIQLADTKNNHELLGYYFDVNTEAGTFDINKVTECILLQNGVPILDNAVLQLTAVKKNGVNNNYTQRVEYDVIIKDKTADFFTKLGSKELTDLKFSEFDHVYNAANVVGSFDNTIVDGFKYLLPYGPDSLYNLEEFKPAIYAKLYFDRIFNTNGFSYEWADLDNNETRFDKLIIPFNGDEKQLSDSVKESVTVRAESSTSQEINWRSGVYETVVIDNETLDEQGYYNPSLSKYTSNFNIVAPNLISYRIELDFNLMLRNTEGVQIFSTALKTIRPLLVLKNGLGDLLETSIITPDTINYSGCSVDSNGRTNIDAVYSLFNTGDTDLVSGKIQLEFNVNNISILEELFVKGVVTLSVASPFFRLDTSGVATNFDFVLKINSIKAEIFPNVEGILYNMPISLNSYIPLKVKQSDFIKSIFTMYNLFAEVDQFNSSKLILKSRNKYYDEGKEKDWTAKLDKSREQVVTFLPSLQNKRLRLTYKQDSDDANKGYYENTGEIYGQVEYIFKNEFVKDVEQKELIFSPTPIAETEFNAVVPIVNGRTPKNNIRILYDGGEWDCQTYTILNYVGATPTAVNTYPSLSHFDRPYNPTFDINFAVCDYYFFSTLGTKTNNTLYNLNWRRSIGQIDNGKMLTAYFNLNEADISGLRLSDRIFILDSWWNINRLEYDANSNNTTKAELISVDIEQKLTKFKTALPKPILTGYGVMNSAKQIIEKIFKSNNVNNSLSNIDIQGKNNVIGAAVKSGAVYGNSNIVNAEKALVVGDGFTVNASGLYTERIYFTDDIILDVDSAGNLGSKDQFLTAFRTVDINGKGLYFTGGGAGFDATATGETALGILADNTGTALAALVVENINSTGDAIVINNGNFRFISIPTYADEAAASSLVTGQLYKTATGEIRIKL